MVIHFNSTVSIFLREMLAELLPHLALANAPVCCLWHCVLSAASYIHKNGIAPSPRLQVQTYPSTAYWSSNRGG